MSLKHYGIYLAYPPTIDLRGEGLGRHLAAFLKAAGERDDVRFLIACPSWMRESLINLFEDEWVDQGRFKIISPGKKPLILSVYLRLKAFKGRPSKFGRLRHLVSRLRGRTSRVREWFEKSIVGSRSIVGVLALVALLLPLAILGVLGYLVTGFLRLVQNLLLKAIFRGLERPGISSTYARVKDILAQPKYDTFSVRLNALMTETEVSLLSELISKQRHISAWYCPTAFWPHFNQIPGPRLVCVPDVVLMDFPIGFARGQGIIALDVFRQVSKTIEIGDQFVTYSNQIKWQTLVDRYQVDQSSVHVVPHGVNSLDDLIMMTGLPDNEAATNAFCRSLLATSLQKALNHPHVGIFDRSDLRFLFYASQFRSSKNILNLLRAYEHLLRRRFISHKLLLTGNPRALPEVVDFISEHGLENDVLCLHGLTSQELAACYRLADLAVNPSLYEGGCPFTYTEAVSVGTPVVMARIAVTEEVLVDPELQDATLFDPYDWRSMADKIEWALENRDELYARQRKFYDEVLVKRTWRHVVDDYIAILDAISQPAA